MKKSKWLIAFVAATTLINSYASTSFACGPFIAEAILAFDTNPDLPLKQYLQGELGIICPTFAKSYLVVAYRYLSNKPLTKQQEDAVFKLWKYRVTDIDVPGDDSVAAVWTTARAKVPGTKPVTISTWRRVTPNDDSYDSYADCTRGSFETAVKTLDSKVSKHGLASPFVKDWVAAQDKVFCHCGTPGGGAWQPKGTAAVAEPPFPDIPKDGHDAEVVQDRLYQHAAALFYTGKFDDAFGEFKAISNDQANPYAKIARYMMPRCLVRKATLTKLDNNNYKSTLKSADSLVRSMLSDPSMSFLYSSCRELLGFIAFRDEPAVRLKELSEQVLSDDKAVSVNDYYHSLDDYTALLLNLEGGPIDPYASEPVKKAPIPASARNDDLSDWITVWESDDKSKFEYALEHWRKSQSTPWLLAALHLAPKDKAKTAELLLAAQAVKADSPGYLSIGYEASHVRQLIGETEQATKETMALKEIALKKRLWSAVNLLMDMRGKLPVTVDEFVENSVRRAAAFGYDNAFLIDQFTPPDKSQSNGASINPDTPVFGFENARFMNERMPLSVLTQCCADTKLPKKLRADADQAAWTRAVVLDDGGSRSKIVPALLLDYPDLAPLIKATEQGNDASKKFAAVYMILKNPGMRPYVRGGAPREEQFGKLDTYSDNWWDSTLPDQDVTYQDKGGDIIKSKLKSDDYPKLLTAEQANVGLSEKKKLLSTGSAPTYLCAQVADYAAKNKSDPRVPEALYLAVRASRYGHKEGRTTPYSKKCFELLHLNYPKSPFTVKTPYYY